MDTVVGRRVNHDNSGRTVFRIYECVFFETRLPTSSYDHKTAGAAPGLRTRSVPRRIRPRSLPSTRDEHRDGAFADSARRGETVRGSYVHTSRMMKRARVWRPFRAHTLLIRVDYAAVSRVGRRRRRFRVSRLCRLN